MRKQDEVNSSTTIPETSNTSYPMGMSSIKNAAKMLTLRSIIDPDLPVSYLCPLAPSVTDSHAAQ